MYIICSYFQDFIQKITHLVHEKYHFWITVDWRSSSTPVGSRTLGIVSDASWMVSAQYQRSRAVPGASEDQKSEVGDNPSNTKYFFLKIPSNYLKINGYHKFS